ncbi:Pre-mRNA-processing factor 39 [Hordeum vulgare]|nr:Pre-mRNA-processing factor 39 [Hordeum vulgare]
MDRVLSVSAPSSHDGRSTIARVFINDDSRRWTHASTTALKTESYTWDRVVREWVSAPPVWLGMTPTQKQIYLENWRQRRLAEERLEGQLLEQLKRNAKAKEEKRRVVA